MLRKIHTWLNRSAPTEKKHGASSSRPKLRHRNTLGVESLEGRELLAADVTPIYHVDTSWTTGYQAAISLENHDAAKLTGWVLEFDMSAQITSIWNAKVVSHSGNHYTIAGAAWDADLPGNGSVSFGFVASASSPATPTNYSVNGGSTSTPTVPKLSISNATVNEGDSGTTGAAFTVSLSAASTSAVSVAFNTSAGTATSGTDYTATSGTLTFAPGETSKVITVPVKGDTTVEDDETFYVNLVSATGATIDDNQAVGTITNDDVAPVLPGMSIRDVRITEGNSGTSAARFTVTLSAASSSAATVMYNTSGGTASAGSDYTSASGTLTFAPGETSKVITVSVAGDTSVENDETFYVNLVSATGATIDDNQAVGTIVNDDVAPTPSGDFQFSVISDWTSGFTGQIVVSNSSSAAVTDWQLAFDFAGTIGSIWNAQIVSHSGNHYVVKNAGYNSTITAGGSTSFGFVASRSSASVVPTNYVLSGGSGTVTPPPTNQAPVASNDFGYTNPNQTITIDVLANDTDPDGDALSVSAVTQPAHGTVVLNANSTVNYTPASGFTGSDTFSYTVRDTDGATSTATVSITVAVPSESPQQMFAPYVDMGLWPTYDLVAAAQTTGLRYFSLAFVVAGPSNEPTWAGYSEYGLGTAYDTALRSQISQLRTLGGDVIVSFGGAANQELALVITDVSALQAAYQSVIDAYGLTYIDFDVEGAAVGDKASIDRRNQAIAGLQQAAAAAGRELFVSYTLPVLPTGLTADGVYVIQSAINHGVDVGLVNIMAMDYGDGAAPNPSGKMGDYAIQAANSLYTQLNSLYGSAKSEQQLWSMVGVTPMIGLNDITTETFDQQEARELVAFAEAKGIGRLSMWSLNRDQQNANGKLGYVDNTSSSLLQDPFEFSQIFNGFTGD